MEGTVQFLLIVLLIELTPGPGVLFVVFQSSLGYRYLFSGILGLLTANLLWITLVATGLALIIKNSPALFETLRWFGVAYLTYLGIKIMRNGIGKPSADIEGNAGKSCLLAYLQGLLTSLSNPKALIFFLALLPNFVSQENYIGDLTYFGALKMLSMFVVLSAYGLLGHKIFSYLSFSTLGGIVSKCLGGGIILGAVAVARS